MLRWFFLIAVFGGDGGRTVSLERVTPRTASSCAGSAMRKYYCWDGQIFSTAPGYTPPPKYVLDYWVESAAKNGTDSRGHRSKGQEMADKVHPGAVGHRAGDQERLAKDQAFNDE